MDDDIRWALTETRTWAVVGCSPDPARDSHRIAALLQRRGFRVIPVNPAVEEVLGERCFPSLADVLESEPRRRRRRLPALLGGRRGTSTRRSRSARGRCGCSSGVIDATAAERARAAGLRVVMDRCPAIEMPSSDPSSLDAATSRVRRG